MSEQSDEFVAGLHKLASWLSVHPEYIDRMSPISFWVAESYYSEADTARENMRVHARVLAPCDKNYDSDDFELVKHFGPHKLTVYTKRENVCTKRVVGTKQVERRTYTAEDQRKIDSMERVTVLQDEDIVEWDCPPSLLG